MISISCKQTHGVMLIISTGTYRHFWRGNDENPVQGDFWAGMSPLRRPANGIAAVISVGNMPMPLLRLDPAAEVGQAVGQWVGMLRGGSLAFTADMKLPNLSGSFYTQAYRYECHARFNLGVLDRVAEETDMRNFDPRRFGYRAVFNDAGAQ